MSERSQVKDWQTTATAWELAAFSFRYPTQQLIDVVKSGEWAAAAKEVADAAGASLSPSFDTLAAVAQNTELHALRAEATRLFVGAPNPEVSPYEGIWRAADDGVQGLLFVNPHSMDVERFCKACGLGRPEGTNEPLDHVATEAELMELLALRASGVQLEDASVADADLPEGSPAAAYDKFMADHVQTWMSRFAAKVASTTNQPFYKAAAEYLSALLSA